MAQGDVPTKPPTFTTKDWGAMIRKLWGDDWHKRETSYEFNIGRDRTNVRQFKDSGGASGIYSGTGGG